MPQLRRDRYIIRQRLHDDRRLDRRLQLTQVDIGDAVRQNVLLLLQPFDFAFPRFEFA